MKFTNLILISLLICILINVSLSFSNTYQKSKAEIESELFTAANAKAKLDKRNFDSFKLSTKLKDSHSGSILALKDHEVECPKKNVLTGFHLWGKKGFISNDISLEYNCIGNNAIQEKKIKLKSNTVKYSNAKNSLDKLANIEVNCKEGYLIKEFELEDKKGKQIYWKYKCYQTFVDNCQEKTTDFKNAKWGGVFYKSISSLSAHKIQVPNGYGLQAFKGENKGNEFRIKYTQCKFANVPKNEPKKPKKNKDKNKHKDAIKNLVKKTQNVKKAVKKFINNSVKNKGDRMKPVAHSKEEDKKINKNGQKFCKKFCKAGDGKKKCQQGKTVNCNTCILKKIPDTTTKMRQNILCGSICNQIAGLNECTFYPFKMTIKKKPVDGDMLSKSTAGL